MSVGGQTARLLCTRFFGDLRILAFSPVFPLRILGYLGLVKFLAIFPHICTSFHHRIPCFLVILYSHITHSVSYSLPHSCFHTHMDPPPAFWPHEGTLFMAKREFMSKARSLLKGKKNIRRRRRLRLWLQSTAQDDGPGSHSTPPHWADTRWAGWYDCTKRHSCSFVSFHEWVRVEAATPDAPATVTDFIEWLNANSATIRLLLLLVVEHACEVFSLLDKVQVSVASTFVQEEEKRRPKPTMHSVFNCMHALHCTLQQLLDTKKLHTHTHTHTKAHLARKKPSCDNMHVANMWRKKLLEVVTDVHAKMWKYVSKHMDFAKQARVLDPTQIGALPQDFATFPLIFAPNVQQKVVDNGEWKVYRESVTPASPQFDILAWWDAMASRVPTLYSIARRVLAIPHTSCDVERSFSVWKHVRSEKQKSMKEGTHKAYVSFCFNGVVPPA